ncbi:SLATT domain-containing protein [Nocardia sp. NPDC127579]|uniref:SLATT domain-containing protein n=1 Tax=Nocardia sp. NPDC127579 TaxID=3345402 RepID=UPI00362B065E
MVEIPADMPAELDPIAQEVHRILEGAIWSTHGQFEQMKIWRAMNMVLGVPAAILAAIAGGTGLAATEATSVPGILALTAAGFGAALTTLNPSRRAEQTHAAGNAYLELQTAARQLLTIRLSRLGFEEAEEELRALTARRDTINKAADPINAFSYRRARRNISPKGKQDFAVDRRANIATTS